MVMKINKRTMIIGIIIALQLVVLVSLYSLNEKVERLLIVDNNDYLYRGLDVLSNNIAQLEDKINQEATLISDSYLEIGEMDTKTLTYPLTFCVLPKTYTENSKLYLMLDNKKIALEKVGDIFKATIKADATAVYQPTAIIIDNDGVLQSQKLDRKDNLEAEKHLYTMLPVILTRFEGNINYGDLTNNATALIKYNCTYKIYNQNNDLSEKYQRQPLNIESVKFIVSINDKQIETYDIPKAVQSDDDCDYLIEIDKSYELKENDIIKMTFVANIENGLIYEKIIEAYRVDNRIGNNQTKREELGANPALIKDKNGKIIVKMYD